MKKLQKTLFWTILATQSSHVFCCGLPGVVSMLSLLTGLGMVSTLPPVLENLHESIHQYEVPILIFSGVILVLGWALDAMSHKIDCHDTGCTHPPCAPKKNSAHKILILSTLLFVINVAIYVFFHHVG